MQGRTDTCQHILVLQVVPLDVIDYLVIDSTIIIIIVAVGVLPSLPRLQLLLLLLPLVLIRLPQLLARGVIHCPHR